MNKFFFSFIIQGLCKILGLKKKYDILMILGTTKLGDIYKLSHNWPHLFKRIFMEETLDYVITPYLLEGNSINQNELKKRISQVINTFIIILLILIITFFFNIKYLIPSVYSNVHEIKYFYKLFFTLIIPMTGIMMGNTILNTKQYFLYTGMGQIINNLMFIIIIYSHWFENLYLIWFCCLMGYLGQIIYLFIPILYHKYIKISLEILPKNIIFDILKSCLFQFFNRFNHLVANFLGSRLMVQGVLMATDLCDNIIISCVSIFAITISIIATPIFYKYFCLKESFQRQCYEIIIGTLVVASLIGGFLSLNGFYVIEFLVGHKNNINNQLLVSIIKFSSFQIILLSLVKILQRIVTLQKKLNKTLFMVFVSSMISTVIEIVLYKKLGIKAMIISQYVFSILEIIGILFILKNDTQWIKLTNHISKKKILIIILKIIILLLFSKFLNSHLLLSFSHWKFLLINGCWGLLTLLILWNHIKIFIIKN